MNTYECKQCGMAVKATCGNCDVSKCPECEGKIKSPMCCGADMSCNL